jgi:hypothetical protein
MLDDMVNIHLRVVWEKGVAVVVVFVGYKGGEIYWLAIHSNQAYLTVGGLRHRRHQ